MTLIYYMLPLALAREALVNVVQHTLMHQQSVCFRWPNVAMLPLVTRDILKKVLRHFS